MKLKLRVLAVILLLVITFLSVNAADSEQPGGTTITITGKGQPSVEKDPNGVIKWKCEDTSTNECTITISNQ